MNDTDLEAFFHHLLNDQDQDEVVCELLAQAGFSQEKLEEHGYLLDDRLTQAAEQGISGLVVLKVFLTWLICCATMGLCLLIRCRNGINDIVPEVLFDLMFGFTGALVITGLWTNLGPNPVSKPKQGECPPRALAQGSSNVSPELSPEQPGDPLQDAKREQPDTQAQRKAPNTLRDWRRGKGRTRCSRIRIDFPWPPPHQEQ